MKTRQERAAKLRENKGKYDEKALAAEVKKCANRRQASRVILETFEQFGMATSEHPVPEIVLAEFNKLPAQ